MGYQIFTGHRLESLVETHLEAFRAPFFGARPLVVLQSQSLAQWLKLFLAQRTGGYATGDFCFQDEALRRLLEGHARTPEPLLFLDDLKFALYRRLAEVLTGDVEPVFRPLLGPTGTPDPLRLFELADHIAGTFHNYAMNSSWWPQALASGQVPSMVKDEAVGFEWQSRLWQDLLGGAQGTLAGVVMERLTLKPPVATGTPARLVLVGSAFLSRRTAAFLRAWADAGLVEITHLLLLPSPADLLSQPTERRPWSSWGAFGRAFLENFPLPAPELTAALPPSTALEGLQAALASGRRPESLVPDGSLEVVSCPHPLRELEVLRDRLLTALAADPTLELNDIAVLAPDINVYAPFLDAALGSDDGGRNLRYHVIDLNLGKENTWLRSLDALMTLVSGTMDRPSLFALIDAEAFIEAWGVEGDDRELWLDYTEEVSAWREDSTSEGTPQSWTASWDRLLGGWFRLDRLETSPSAFRSLGRLHALVEQLRARARETRRERPFLEWVRFLDQTVAAFLAPGDGTGAALSGRLRTLALDAGSPSQNLPWAGFRAFVQDQIAHFPGRRGQLMTEGVHCSSLRPLRAIPFRIIAVLGLDESSFPRRSLTPSFDLRRHEPGQDAVSSLALDRYSFWETIMAARSLLYLSYQGRSAIDGTERPPSPVLADLLDFLEEAGSPWPVAQATVKDFSLSPESPVVWSPRSYRRAEAVRTRSREVPPVQEEAPTIDASFPEVRSSDIVLALTAPARFHLQKVRQVVLREEDRRGVDDEEPWALSFLDRQGWLQEELRRSLQGDETAWDVEAFLRSVSETGRSREGVFSQRDRRVLTVQAEAVARWAQDLKAEGWTAAAQPRSRARWVGRPWAVEPADRFCRSGEILLPRLLYSKAVPARTKVEAAVRHLLDPAEGAHLATLNPEGERRFLSWSHGPNETQELAAQVEAFWSEAALRPLPFYPDWLEAVAKRRSRQDQEPWPTTLEEAWRTVMGAVNVVSPNTLTRCPYAALAFPQEPEPERLVQLLDPWWDSLFVPLLEAWQ